MDGDGAQQRHEDGFVLWVRPGRAVLRCIRYELLPVGWINVVGKGTAAYRTTVRIGFSGCLPLDFVVVWQWFSQRGAAPGQLFRCRRRIESIIANDLAMRCRNVEEISLDELQNGQGHTVPR